MTRESRHRPPPSITRQGTLPSGLLLSTTSAPRVFQHELEVELLLGHHDAHLADVGAGETDEFHGRGRADAGRGGRRNHSSKGSRRAGRFQRCRVKSHGGPAGWQIERSSGRRAGNDTSATHHASGAAHANGSPPPGCAPAAARSRPGSGLQPSLQARMRAGAVVTASKHCFIAACEVICRHVLGPSPRLPACRPSRANTTGPRGRGRSPP